MFYQYTDDPAADWDAHCRDEEAYKEKLPVCDICGMVIEGEHVWDIDGTLYCEDCIDDCRHSIDKYIKD